MIFTSLIFFFAFFPISVLGYWGIDFLSQKVAVVEKFRIKDIFLIGVSLAFYGWAFLNHIFYFVAFIGFVFMVGKVLEQRNKKYVVASAVTILALILYVYKYTNFSIDILNSIFQSEHQGFSLIVPLGISFIIFSAVSYLVDIYRGDAKAGNLIDVALYLSFFPKVISGPIELWKNFQPQLKRKMPNSEQILSGINRIIIGMGKKVILADTFGSMIAKIDSNIPLGIDTATAWGGALLYMLQIYYDFAGYSDIAIGLARLFGIEIKDNFNFPYISKSITEFWRRWHISLGTWFREYIYIPLGGNRKGAIRTLLNLFLVFVLTGIWHGAGYNYILWGVINGVCVVLERCIQDKKWYIKIPQWIKWIFTMAIIFFSWQVFRLPELVNVGDYFKIMFGITQAPQVSLGFLYYFEFKIIALVIIGIIGATAFASKPARLVTGIVQKNTVIYAIWQIILLVLGFVDVLSIVNSTYSPFLYFQY